jgi:hypothetical protein
MRHLAAWLINVPGFRERLKQLTIASVGRQFNLPSPYEVRFTEDREVDYLLLCASVLAHSTDGRCQDAALRIAHYCLSGPHAKTNQTDGAALVLDALTNHAALRLAERRGLLDLGYEERLPFSAQVEATYRKIEHTIAIKGQADVHANRFQSLFWDAIRNTKWLSVSAPTSAGKSFILEVWIQDYLSNEGQRAVVYIVPTRALISEVEAELVQRLDPSATGIPNVTSLPLAKSWRADCSNVFVFTQERLHIFLNSFTEPPKIDVLIVDEAHKVGDSYRGAFLQQVIESVSEQNRDLKVIFASPFTSNPELLLQDAPAENAASVMSSDVTVNQNLLWVTQQARRPKQWDLSLCLPDEVVEIGKFSLPNGPSPESKRLPFVALALSMGGPGNIVYVNGASEAEKTALQLYDSLEPGGKVDDEIANLIELCEKTIHKRFVLNRTLQRGVAFHYGNMPLLVKGEIERLFTANKIRFLVCTSTLIEGVNMACRNIFMRGPKKGRDRLMGAEDFWNLAGRAGRWGKEFQGNVFCVDSDNSAIWQGGEPPRTKIGIRMSRTTDQVIGQAPSVVEYIESPDHYALSAKHPDWEYVFSYLCVTRLRYQSLGESPYLRKHSPAAVAALDAAVAGALSRISLPQSVLERNPGISPLLMQSLLERFSRPTDKPLERLLLAEPSSQDALTSYRDAFTRIGQHLSPKLGFTINQAYVRALLVVKWMRGFPLSRLISDRLDYLRSKGPVSNEAGTIREVMKDVEELARYQAPRLLACYNDVLRHFLITFGRLDLAAQLEDLSVYLELGLNQQTQLALVGLGLSRTAAVMLSETIANDKLDERECIAWLAAGTWRNLDFPALVKAEIERVFSRAAGANASRA